MKMHKVQVHDAETLTNCCFSRSPRSSSKLLTSLSPSVWTEQNLHYYCFQILHWTHGHSNLQPQNLPLYLLPHPKLSHHVKHFLTSLQLFLQLQILWHSNHVISTCTLQQARFTIKVKSKSTYGKEKENDICSIHKLVCKYKCVRIMKQDLSVSKGPGHAMPQCHTMLLGCSDTTYKQSKKNASHRPTFVLSV